MQAHTYTHIHKYTRLYRQTCMHIDLQASRYVYHLKLKKKAMITKTGVPLDIMFVVIKIMSDEKNVIIVSKCMFWALK